MSKSVPTLARFGCEVVAALSFTIENGPRYSEGLGAHVRAPRHHVGALRRHVGAPRGHVGALRGPAGALRSHVGALRGHVGALRAHVVALGSKVLPAFTIKGPFSLNKPKRDVPPGPP